MSRIIKLLGSEVALGTATTVGHASLVRVINTGAVQVATVKLGAAVTGTITIGANQEAFIKKQPAETIQGAATLKGVHVAFSS